MLSYLGHVLNALNCVQTQSGSSYSRREGLLSQTQYGEMSTGPACRQTPHKLLIMRVDINILACLMPGSQQTHSVRRACEWGRYRQRGLNDLLICAGLIWISEPGCWEALLGRWADCRRSVCVCVCACRSADGHAWPQKHTLQSCMLFQKAKCLHTDQKFSSCECFQCCLLISWHITVSFWADW